MAKLPLDPDSVSLPLAFEIVPLQPRLSLEPCNTRYVSLCVTDWIALVLIWPSGSLSPTVLAATSTQKNWGMPRLSTVPCLHSPLDWQAIATSAAQISGFVPSKSPAKAGGTAILADNTPASTADFKAPISMLPRSN